MAQKISDPTVLFKAYVDLANVSTHVIWARNSAMLVANSFMIVAFTGAELQAVQWTIALAGVAVCLLWLVMTCVGWSYFYQRHDHVTKDTDIPPFVRRKWIGDVIFICNVALILVFLIIYLVFLFYSGLVD
jgi:hypothetical protein